MEPTDPTISILKEIRDDARSFSEQMKEQFERVDQRFERMDQGIKTALETRSATDARFDDHERRLAALESAASE